MLVIFLALIKYPTKATLQKGGVYFGSWFEGAVHHGEEVAGAGVWDRWSHGNRSQGEADKRGTQLSFFFVFCPGTPVRETVLPVFSMSLPCSAKPLRKHLIDMYQEVCFHGDSEVH